MSLRTEVVPDNVKTLVIDGEIVGKLGDDVLENKEERVTATEDDEDDEDVGIATVPLTLILDDREFVLHDEALFTPLVEAE